MRLCTPLFAALSTSVTLGCSSGSDFERPDKPGSTRYTPEALALQTSAGGGPGGAAQTFVPAKALYRSTVPSAFQDVANALRALQSDADALRAQAARCTDTAALFQALGGGWWNRTDVDPRPMDKPGVFALPPVQDIRLPRAAR